MQSALSYGVDMALYTILSTAGLLLICLLMNSLIFGIVIIATCYLNQTIGGGYHASTHARCFLSMALFLVLGIVFCKLNIPELALYSMGTISIVVLFMQPVVLHPNRSFLKNRLPFFTKRSRCIIAFELLIIFVFAITGSQLLNAFIIALVLSAISRIAAKHSKHCNADFCDGSRGE